MPAINTGDIQTYYEINGQGLPLVFIHGGWVSHRMWQSQVDHFSKSYMVITCDIRGHGNTGGSLKKKYSMELFADDLYALLKALRIDKPIICGLSMGGMIAQTYAVKYPENLAALILSDTAASSALTAGDKITKYLLAPEWLFLFLVRLLGIKRYADFAFWYAAKSRNKNWIGLDKKVSEYEKQEMLQFGTIEFNKIFSSLYDFKLQDLSKIKVKTLILNGEFESGAVFAHADRMLQLIPDAKSVIIPSAGHTSNMENPRAFNKAVEDFLRESGF
jgi:pimeloyl-ACP methyl ester carboxylesterase